MSEGKKNKPGENGKDKIKESPERYMVEDRHEIIDGVRYDLLASPKYAHQKLLGKLYVLFHSSCAADGEVLLAPMDVHLDDKNIFQPDVLYISKENKGIIRDGYIYGAPDLVVEILSESTAKRDKSIKKNGYERFGVKEYWLADPVHKFIEQLVLVDGRYRLVAVLAEEDRLISATVPCLALDLSEAFADDL